MSGLLDYASHGFRSVHLRLCRSVRAKHTTHCRILPVSAGFCGPTAWPQSECTRNCTCVIRFLNRGNGSTLEFLPCRTSWVPSGRPGACSSGAEVSRATPGMESSSPQMVHACEMCTLRSEQSHVCLLCPLCKELEYT